MAKTLYITRNSTFVQRFVVGGDFDLSVYTPIMIISKYYGSKKVYHVSITVENILERILKCSISDAGTAMLPAGMMVYSVYINHPTLGKTPLINSNVVVIPTVFAEIPVEEPVEEPIGE